MRRPRAPEEGVRLSVDEFRLLRELLASRTGIALGPESRASVERRLGERLSVLRLESFAEYHHYLRFGLNAASEWDEAIEALTTNETYFFREERQLRAFEHEVLPMLHADALRRRRLSIWSAGCSTGEEVYTLGMLVHRSHLFPSPEWDVRIYGSDISRRCVAAARHGVYGEKSFRALPGSVRRAFFAHKPDGWHVADRIRYLCHFGQMNLLEGYRSGVVAPVDAVFCRNVLIYLEPAARKSVVDVLHERLRPGGILLLGHSESLMNVSTAFELLHLSGDLVYRKPLSAPGPNGMR